ncbi:Ribosomal lysine N-methyltransferase 4 [Cryptotrichosporon argae]
MTFNAQYLVESFKSAGGSISEELFDLEPVEGMGWGAVARRRIEPETPLFHIPTSLLLSPWTCGLRTRLSEAEWDSLDGGWARLILGMMYETSLGSSSRWAGYLSNMPTSFDTPMFWDEADRALLKGTDIEERIGKEDAEQEYRDKIVPLLSAHPDVFPPGSPHFSLTAFHTHGSRILSRSFTIPVSRAGGPRTPAGGVEGEDSDDDEEEEMVAVMVPIADMLNAAYERDNARLFEDERGYAMISTKPIEAGEQIYNTYDSPPNSELLRKYGHVDALPLPADLGERLDPAGPESLGAWPYGNPGDEVGLTGDRVVAAAGGGLEERVEWWLEEGEDDTFPLTLGVELDPALVSFARLLTNDADWERARHKGKTPKPVLDEPAAAVLARAVADREAGYAMSLEDDLAAILDPAARLNARNAAVVRLGERRILRAAARALEAARQGLAGGAGKRKAEADAGGREKRRA